MTKKFSEPKILLDCDVIIHFIKAGKQLLLPKIYPGRLVILDKIFNELMLRPSNKIPVGNFISYSKIEVIPMPKNIEIIKEYAFLKKTKGDGEAACMAVARHTNEYIASSNLKDIRIYCEQHSIVYLTTMDILLEAYKLEIMSEVECDAFIREVKSKDSILIHNIDSITAYEKLKK
jgi:predicted nucleic acid-binding protein